MTTPEEKQEENTENQLRTLIVSNIMSIDGYYEGPGTGPNTMPIAEASDAAVFDAYNAERLRAADTLLVGRTSYEMFRNFWPSVVDDPDATPTQQEISRLNNAIEKVVISDSLSAEQTDPWSNTRVIRRADAHEQIAELKRHPGEDILVFGSRTLWTDLLATDLVDELHLMVGPVVFGDGTPIFDDQPAVSFRLIDTRTWDESGNVLMQYEVHHQQT